MIKKTDEEITGDIIAAFGASPNVHATDMIVSTQDGKVRLMGVVCTLEESDEAERIASRVAGVTGVENDIVISPDKEISDHEMTEALNAELSSHPDLVGIGGRVNAGTAFLMGKVSSVAVRNRAIDVASGVEGVREVISDLQIAAGEPVDDIRLANDVTEAISDDPDINTIELESHARNGLVVITGEVETQREYNLITERASAVPGVKHVQNLVRVQRGVMSTPSRKPTVRGTEYPEEPIVQQVVAGTGQSFFVQHKSE